VYGTELELYLGYGRSHDLKASFIPGDLHLTEIEAGFHSVLLNGKEVFRTRSEKAAAAKFNRLRQEMEAKYPAAPLTQEQREEIFKQARLDSMVGHNSLGGRKKKTSAGGTRTFGG
jgi:hypothetical protein